VSQSNSTSEPNRSRFQWTSAATTKAVRSSKLFPACVDAAPVRALKRRLIILGLDGVPPEFLFDRFLPLMPNLRELLARGRYGGLRSCDPPTSVPAWTVLFTGMDPGCLGFYGHRHRKPGTYTTMYTPTPEMIPYPAIWNILSQLGFRVVVIGVPPGYPPPRVNGIYISDFLTPRAATDFVTPHALAPEIQEVAGSYQFDVLFRTEERERIAREIFAMTEKRFRVARHLWKKEPWDLFVVHEVGPDRLHHAFWKYFDPAHPRHILDATLSTIADRYYALLDKEIGELLKLVPDDVPILVVSDHGCQSMAGCFCINDWLQRRGYLHLNGAPVAPNTPLEGAPVDWGKTSAWGLGGYFARIFFNVRGRDPQGIIEPGEVPQLARRLVADLAQVRRPDGRPLGVEVIEPTQAYREVRGDPPDLMLYFGDLRWRSAGTLGHDSFFLDENDTGPDDAVHSFEGVFALLHSPTQAPARLPTQSILDVAPTILELMGVERPQAMQGKPIRALLD
jgi:predicted AlkP superfamily phosphohydrolase/phosphomutase